MFEIKDELNGIDFRQIEVAENDMNEGSLQNEDFCAQFLKNTIKTLFGEEDDSNQKVENFYFDDLGEECLVEEAPEQIEPIVQLIAEPIITEPVIVQHNKPKRKGRPPITDLEEKNRRKRETTVKAAQKYRRNKRGDKKLLDLHFSQLTQKHETLEKKVQDLQISHRSYRSLCMKYINRFKETDKRKVLQIIKKYSNK